MSEARAASADTVESAGPQSEASRDWEAPEAVPQRQPLRTQWYGWQTLSVDAASVALIIAQIATETTPAILAIGGVATYLLGSPLVLLAHQNTWSLGSLVLRLAAVGLVVGGAIVALSGGCLAIFGDEPEGCDTRQSVGGVMMIMGALGIPTTIALDAIFARDKPTRKRSAPWISVWVDPIHAGLGVSVLVQRL